MAIANTAIKYPYGGIIDLMANLIRSRSAMLSVVARLLGYATGGGVVAPINGRLSLTALAVLPIAWQSMCALGLTSAMPNGSSLIVFGDSYQDNGRQFQITYAAASDNVPEAALAPAAISYWNGRWSNGETMVEVAARKLGVVLRDYAVGGATSAYGNYDTWMDSVGATGILGQIDSYEKTLVNGLADPRAIYIVSASTNDYAKYHDGKSRGSNVKGSSTKEYFRFGVDVARNVVGAVKRLLNMGARRVVVFSSYAISQSPLATRVDPQVAEAMAFTQGFDAALANEVKTLKTPGASVSIFWIGNRMREMTANPKKYGLSNVTVACQVTLPQREEPCAAPELFLWWDELHPTARVHVLLGDLLAQSLRKYPVPATRK